MSFQIFKTRFLAIFGLSFLIIVIAISVSLIQKGIFYVGKATPDPSPQNVRITNVTDTSFTVTYTTKGQYEGVIALRSGNGTKIFLDDRDRSSGVKEKYNSHHITALNLLPNSTYIFQIISGGNVYENASFSVVTGSIIADPPPTQNPLYGKVIHKDGSDARDSLIFAKNESSLPVSSVTNDRGEFIIPTNSLRTTTNDSYSILNDKSIFEIQVINKDLISSVNTEFKVAQNLPTITLERTYYLTENTEKKALPPVLFVNEKDELLVNSESIALSEQNYSTEGGILVTPTAIPTNIADGILAEEEQNKTASILSITNLIIQSLFPFLKQ